MPDPSLPSQILKRDDSYYMRLAIAQAHRAEELNEVPVGAVLVAPSGEIIACACNETISRHDPTAHAEILCLREAGSRINNYRLLDLTLYVTLEPCVMCAMALIHARIGRLVFGTCDLKTGACGSVFDILSDPRHNHHLTVTQGVLKEECAKQLSSFFARRRAEIRKACGLKKASEGAAGV